jgi:hypothetical protein
MRRKEQGARGINSDSRERHWGETTERKRLRRAHETSGIGDELIVGIHQAFY